MAALTIGQAAATLAIAQVGVATGVFDQEILNAAVLTVVFTVLITSFATRFFARRIEAPAFIEPTLGSLVLVNAPGPEDADAIVSIAARVASRDGGLVTPFVIATEAGAAPDIERLERTVTTATRLGQDSEGIVRHGSSLAAKSHNLALETGASLLLLPWDGPTANFSLNDLLPDRRIDEVGRSSPTPVAAVAAHTAAWNRVIVMTGRYSSVYTRREDVAIAIDLATALLPEKDAKVLVYTSDPRGGADLVSDHVEVVAYQAGSADILDQVGESDLLVVPPHVAQIAGGFGTRRINRVFAKTSLIVVGGPGRLSLSRQQPHGMNLGFSPSRAGR